MKEKLIFFINQQKFNKDIRRFRIEFIIRFGHQFHI